MTGQERFNIFKNTISIVFLASYILFSIVKRLFDTPNLFWIPLCLLIANFFFILEILYSWFIKKSQYTNKNLVWVSVQLIATTGLIILITTYL